MEIKKIRFVFLALLMILSTVGGALAVEEKVYFDDLNPVLGSKDFDVKLSEMSFFEMIKYSFRNIQAMTVVNDATCSIQPDKIVNDWSPAVGQTQLCYKNDDHVGVAFQMFISETDGVPTWNYQGEHKIANGEEKCFIVRVGNKYTYTLYNCDSTSVRSCTDTDGGRDYDTRGTVTFTLDGASNSETDFCYDFDKLSEIYCDVDNSMASKATNCDGRCSNGACVDDLVETTEVSFDGKTIDIVEVLTNKKEYQIGDRIIIIGVAEINRDVTGGIIETSTFLPFYSQVNPLSIVEANSEEDIGVCGDDMTTGVKFNANAGDKVVFKLNMVAGKEGAYSTKVISAVACGEDMEDYETIQFKILPTAGVESNNETDIVAIEPINNIVDGSPVIYPETDNSFVDIKTLFDDTEEDGIDLASFFGNDEEDNAVVSTPNIGEDLNNDNRNIVFTTIFAIVLIIGSAIYVMRKRKK